MWTWNTRLLLSSLQASITYPVGALQHLLQKTIEMILICRWFCDDLLIVKSQATSQIIQLLI
jgi:hypothetical protein